LDFYHEKNVRRRRRRSDINIKKKQNFDEKTDVKTTFKDVAGLEGAKEEIQEIVEFRKPREIHTNLVVKFQRGLLVGPPGTGTLLAKRLLEKRKCHFSLLSGSILLKCL
jgi:cell division protease FtsH